MLPEAFAKAQQSPLDLENTNFEDEMYINLYIQYWGDRFLRVLSTCYIFENLN